MGIIQRDGCNRVRGQQTESTEERRAWSKSGHPSAALTLRMSRAFTGLHCTLWETLLSPYHVVGLASFGSSEQH